MITGENIETRLARILEIQYGHLDANAFSLILDLIEKEKQALNIDDVSKSCFNCNGWGYTLLPNGRRDKTCEVCK